MEAPVVLDAFLLPCTDFRHNGIPRLLNQSLVILEQSPHHHIAGQPYLVLPRHAKPRIFHQFDGLLPFIGRQMFFKQNEGYTQRTRHTNLIVVPVRAFQLFLEPESQSSVYGPNHLFRLIILTVFILTGFHQAQNAFRMQTGLPTRTGLVGVIDIRPGPLLILLGKQLFNESLTERNPLLKFHHHSVRYAKTRRIGLQSLLKSVCQGRTCDVDFLEIFLDFQQIPCSAVRPRSMITTQQRTNNQ